MNSSRTWEKLAGISAITVLLATPGMAAATSRSLVLWDTTSRIGDKLKPEDRANWKAVPNDLLGLEKDPLKASSDPGYYGRDYAFAGDAVVETPKLTAAFNSAKGRVILYAKPEAAAEWPGASIVDLSPIPHPDATAPISHLEVLRNAGDEIILKVVFSLPGSPEATAIFSFDPTGIVEVKPVEHLEQVRLSGTIAYGVVPGFGGDDLIFGGEQPGTNRLSIPAENLLLGLLPGENSELVVTWPKGHQRLTLSRGQGTPGIQSIDFANDGHSFYLAALTAPGLWHTEALKPTFLEKDVKLQWKRPYSARWKTQLYEEGVKTTFAFRDFKGEIWRGVAGSYVFPAWFNGEDAFCHLGKKVPPKGESIIYCLEGKDTPPGILTPADVLRQTLGREACEPILDLAGRKLRTHHRRGAEGVRRACTCGCTEAIQAIFEAGEEVSRKADIQGELDDMVYFVHRHVERINEYRQFADDLVKALQEKRATAPELTSFLDRLEEIARQIPQECEVQKENMKSFTYADDLFRQTLALTAKTDPGNVKAYMELLKAWRGMGGAQDYVLAKCHTITRNLCQAAGYSCGGLPSAVPLAEEIRARCRQTLRNADGYEIWADY